MQYLKQSTAFTFRIGPFLDEDDGKTAETALTIVQADMQISKAGGAFAQTSASPTTTHDTDGWYQCPLTTTDTGTLGTLDIQIHVSGALPVWRHFNVVTAEWFDTMYSTDNLTVKGFTTAGKAEIESECNDALVAQSLDHLVAVADADDVVDDSIMAKIASKSATADWSGFSNLTDSLEAIADGAITTANVKTQIVAALATDTYAAPSQGAPASTTTLALMLRYLYVFLRNKTEETSTLQSLYADDGSTVLTKATMSDNGTTFTKSEFVSGA